MTKKKSKPKSREDAADSRSDTEHRADVAAGPNSGAEADAEVDTEAKEGRSLSREELLARLSEKSEQLQEMRRELAQKSNEIKELKDKWLRSVAEFENYRKRSHKEWELLKQHSKTEVILEILSVVDDFERAFAVVEGSGEDEFVQGIRLIHNNLMQVLTKLGVSEAEAQGVPFDPRYHEAISQVESDTAESGSVVEVVEKGYLFDDTVIRPAKVVVAK